MEAPPLRPKSDVPSPAPVPPLAVASLVLGVLGLVGSVVLVGAVLALVGLMLGALHLRRRAGARGMGWAGVWLSAFGLAASLGFGVFYVAVLPRWAASLEGSGEANLEGWRGRAAPDFEFNALDGSRHRLSDWKGRRVVLDFWATWCGPCVQEVPHFSRLSREADTNRLVILGISNEDRTVLKAFAEARGIPYLLASAEGIDLPQPYNRVHAIPTTFFIDTEGRIEAVTVGGKSYEVLRERALGQNPGNPAGPAAERGRE